MKLEILQGDTVLRQYSHNSRFFAEAPPQGAYKIRVTNESNAKRLAVVAVDGVNVVTGEDATVNGPGYVLRPRESVIIPGWRRDGEKVAKFTFQSQEGSYANRTGRGTKNTGIIGVAIYDEKPNPIRNILRSAGDGFNSRGIAPMSSTMDSWSGDDELADGFSGHGTAGMDWADSSTVVNAVHDGSEPQMTVASASAAAAEPVSYTGLGSTTKSAESPKMGRTVKRRRRTVSKSAEPVSLGTGYGKETAFHTETTTFDRSTVAPVEKLELQYAVREMLVKWGIEVHEDPPKPEAFPASVPAPPGWQANR
jgi:hypothetical protein